MSFAYRSGREWRVLALLLVLGLAGGAQTASAASFAIDIDPASPTLGDLLDRETRSTKTLAKTNTYPRVAPAAPVHPTPVTAPPPAQATAPIAPPPPRSISSEPIIPRNAATVNVKRAKSRAPTPPIRPKPRPEASVLAPTPEAAARIHPAIVPPRVAEPIVAMPSPPPRPVVTAPVEMPPLPMPETRQARQPEALPPALDMPMPTPRLAPRKIEIPPAHPQAKASAVRDQAALLRDPTITHSSEALGPASGGRAKGKGRSFEDEDVQDLPPATAPTPRIVLPPLEEPARAAPPRSTPKAAEPTAPKSVPEAKTAPAAKPVEAPKVPAAKAEPGKADTAKADGATKPPGEGDKIVYVIDQDLRQFLTDFARRAGLRSDIASNVRGRLTKVKLPAEPNALLRELERRHDFEWVIEGEILKVSSRAEMATRILPLGPLAYDDLVREMKNADIDAARYPMRKLGDSNAIFITAPATHIGRIAALIDVLKAGKTVGPDLRIVRNGITRKVEWD